MGCYVTENSAMVASTSHDKGAFTLDKRTMIDYLMVEVRMRVLNTLRSSGSDDDSSQNVAQIYLKSTKGTVPQISTIQTKRLVMEPMPSSPMPPLSNLTLAQHLSNLSKGQMTRSNTSVAKMVDSGGYPWFTPSSMVISPPCAIFPTMADCA